VSKALPKDRPHLTIYRMLMISLIGLVGQLATRLQLGVRDIGNIAIACGVAAAISTAFNAPIAGLIFTHEVILRHYSLRIFTAVTVATVSGFVVTNVIFQRPPLFLIEIERVFYASEFFLFALEGIASGVLAVVFMKLLWAAERLSSRLQLPAPSKPMLAGFLLSLVALQIPEVLGHRYRFRKSLPWPGTSRPASGKPGRHNPGNTGISLRVDLR